MKIAYLISAHTDAPQLKRLIDALHADAHFFVHIDRKSDIMQFNAIINNDNVHFIENRTDVRWGTILEVEYQINLMKAAIEHPTHFDRIFFLSGMDYPLWSNQQITEWLNNQGDKEILCGMDMTTNDIGSQQHDLYTTSRPFFNIGMLGNKGNQRLSIICRKIKKMLGIRKKLTFAVDGKTWRLYKGSAWWCISQELASHICAVYDEKSEIRKYFTDSFGQAETLIQTIAFNSAEWADKCILHTGRYPGLAALTPLHFIIYEPVIKVMDENDFEMLIQSGRMFTRKLQSGKSDRLVELLTDRVNEHINNKN